MIEKSLLLLLQTFCLIKISLPPHRIGEGDKHQKERLAENLETRIKIGLGFFVASVFGYLFVLYESWMAGGTLHRLGWWDLFSLGLCLTGCFVRLWCYETLGRLFTFDLAIRKEHTIIKEGPYAYVRHPSYSSLYLGSPCPTDPTAYFGFALFTITDDFCQTIAQKMGLEGLRLLLWPSAPVGVALLAAATFPIAWARVKNEEDMLMKEFGTAYQEYSRVTPRFIPFGL
ncbi:hypothetical protein HDU91_007070 [Kappamyces sp. JEL0680]|nr:hypothetical protein HDU91_007070 [Kappamyces sp. JEL0680]